MQKQALKTVLDKRLTQKGLVEYQVLYKGQTNPQWEPIINLKNELDMLADFEVEYETRQQKKAKQDKAKEVEAENRKKQLKLKETDEEEEYEIEEILEKKKTAEGIQYKVKWKGYSLTDCTWEPAENLGNAVVALQKFKEKEQREQQISEETKLKKIKMQEQQKQKANQREEELELTLEDVEEENAKGHFNTDIPEKVVAARPEKDKLMLTIHWKARKDGSIPKDSIFSNKEIFQFNPRFLADYYESKLKFVALPQKANQ